jgi:hypothetical protein
VLKWLMVMMIDLCCDSFGKVPRRFVLHRGASE